MKNNKKGFTLAELLIVVAIIGVLVAISIPVFTTQLEKSREAVDAANIRAAYAEVVAEGILDAATTTTKTVTLKQQTDGWQNSFDFPVNLTADASAAAPAKNGTVTISYDATSGGAKITCKLTK